MQCHLRSHRQAHPGPAHRHAEGGEHLTSHSRALDRLRNDLLDAQFDLNRGRGYSLLIIATGLTAAGRTEALSDLRSWLDPKRLATHAWGKRDDVESARPWAYRYWQAMPRKGEIAIWFDGWYADLFHLAWSHPLRAQVGHRAARIVALENLLAAEGVRLLKWHFDIDADKQKKRIRKLRKDELNSWRISKEDLRYCRQHDRVVQAHTRCQALTEHAGAGWRRFRDAHEGRQAVPLARCLLEAMTAQPDGPAEGRFPAPRRRKASTQKLRAAALAPSRPPQDPELAEQQSRLAHQLQSKRFRKSALVVVLEGMDAAGKSSATKRIIATMDPRQYRIVPTGAPSAEELSHPWLWRFWSGLPGRGQVSIFDRSWYGRVLVERVRRFSPTRDWARAYEEINEFERELLGHRLIVAKFWFALSKQGQGRRFDERKAKPLKRFKVDPEDWENRRHWEEFQVAAADMLALTDTQDAPWRLLPADDKPRTRLQLVRGLNEVLEQRLKRR